VAYPLLVLLQADRAPTTARLRARGIREISAAEPAPAAD
jgi:hypothetical protein